MEKIIKRCPRCNTAQDAKNEECIRCKYYLADVDLYKPKRRPILAFLLSFALSGLGQAYNGQLRKGVILFLSIYIIVIILSIIGLWYTFTGMIIGFIIIAVCKIIISVEASYSASKLKGIFLKPYNKWYIYIVFIIIANLIAFPFSYLIKNNVVRAYKIPSRAMEPTLLVGDHIYFDMRHKEFQRGDVIVFKYPVDPRKDFIKRVIGLPGEKFQIRDKKVFINDQLIKEKYVTYIDKRIIQGNIRPRDNLGPFKIPQNSFFVLGDNRDQSFDSRFWGPVEKPKVKGKGLYIYWSWDTKNFSPRWERIGKKIE